MIVAFMVGPSNGPTCGTRHDSSQGICHASAELLARRVVDLRGGLVAVYDDGRLRSRVARRAQRIDERALVADALERERPARVDDLTGAWPIIDRRFRRVIVLAPPAA